MAYPLPNKVDDQILSASDVYRIVTASNTVITGTGTILDITISANSVNKFLKFSSDVSINIEANYIKSYNFILFLGPTASATAVKTISIAGGGTANDGIHYLHGSFQYIDTGSTYTNPIRIAISGGVAANFVPAVEWYYVDGV